MRFALISFVLLVLIALPVTSVRANAQMQDQGPVIITPTGGQALQGASTITGSTDLAGFQRYELHFAYQNNPTGTWFLIAESDTPVENGALAQWDTTTISDGDYSLRLTVTLQDGSQQSAIVEGLRVRNYTLIETVTPTPVPPTATMAPATQHPTSTATSTSAPSSTPPEYTATPLPPNPAALSKEQALLSLGKGALGGLAAFVILGLYQALRALLHK